MKTGMLKQVIVVFIIIIVLLSFIFGIDFFPKYILGHFAGRALLVIYCVVSYFIIQEAEDEVKELTSFYARTDNNQAQQDVNDAINKKLGKLTKDQYLKVIENDTGILIQIKTVLR